MNFSFRLAFATWLESVLGSWRQRIIREIMRRETLKMTSAMIITEEDGTFFINNITRSGLQDVQKALELAEEFGHGTPTTRILSDRITSRFRDGEEVRS